jgi:hypothetical protein
LNDDFVNERHNLTSEPASQSDPVFWIGLAFGLKKNELRLFRAKLALLKNFDLAIPEPPELSRSRRWRRDRINAYPLPRFIQPLKLHPARNQRKKRPIASNSDIEAGVELRSALPNQNVSRFHNLTAETFYAESLSGAIAAVTGTATCFFMCHELIPRSRD